MVGALAGHALGAADGAADPAADPPLRQPGRLALRHRELSVLLAAAAEAHHRRAGYRRDGALLRRLLCLVGRRGEGPRERRPLDRLRPHRHLALFGQGAAARGLLRLRGRRLYPAAPALGADLGLGAHRGLAGAGQYRLGRRRLSAARSIQLAALHAHGRAGQRRQLSLRAGALHHPAGAGMAAQHACCCPSWQPSAGGGASRCCRCRSSSPCSAMPARAWPCCWSGPAPARAMPCR